MTSMQIAINPELKRKIMRRVYALWFWRSVAPLLGVELVLVVGVAAGVLAHISLRHILLNAISASDGLRAFIQFFVDNFFVKSIQSRLLFGVWLAVMAFFLRDLLSTLGRLRAARPGKGLAAAVWNTPR